MKERNMRGISVRISTADDFSFLSTCLKNPVTVSGYEVLQKYEHLRSSFENILVSFSGNKPIIVSYEGLDIGFVLIEYDQNKSTVSGSLFFDPNPLKKRIIHFTKVFDSIFLLICLHAFKNGTLHYYDTYALPFIVKRMETFFQKQACLLPSGNYSLSANITEDNLRKGLRMFENVDDSFFSIFLDFDKQKMEEFINEKT